MELVSIESFVEQPPAQPQVEYADHGSGGSQATRPAMGLISVNKIRPNFYVAVIQDIIGQPAMYQPLLSILYTLEAEDEIRIMLDTPGGNLMTAITIATAIERCKGKVVVVALGRVQSAGSFIFAFAKHHQVLPGAQFMYHGAIMGMHEKIGTLRDYVAHIEKYTDYLLTRSVALGILTAEEAQSIGQTQSMRHLTGGEVANRMAAKAEEGAAQ